MGGSSRGSEVYLRFVFPLDVSRHFAFLGVVEEGEVEQREVAVTAGRSAGGRARVTSGAGGETEAAGLG